MHISPSLKKGFTLVELIIVITILAILSTIAFISYSSYSIDTRNTVRLQTGKNIEKGLNIFMVQTGKYPDPSSPIQISYGSENVGTQGIIGNEIASQIGMNQAPKDPKTKQPYLYSISQNGNYMALLGFMESNQENIQGGKILGGQGTPIVLENNQSIQNNIDILSSNPSTQYQVHYNQSVYPGDKYLIGSSFIGKNTFLSHLDPTLIGFWDMETKTYDGKLKDFSQYANDLTFLQEGDMPQDPTLIGNVNGLIGKATSFDGESYFKINVENTSLNWTGATSFLSTFKPVDTGHYGIFSTNDGDGYELFINDQKKFKFFDGALDGYSQEFITTSTGFQMGSITYNPTGKVTVFQNNTIITDSGYIYNADGPFPLPSNSDFFLGSQQAWWGFFEGIIDDSRIYKRELTAGEVQFFSDIFTQ